MISYDDAKQVNNRLIKFYKKKKVILQPVGSFARHENELADLDYITHSKALGHKYYRSAIVFEDREIPYDIWYIPKRYFKLATLMRSYPKHYVISIRKALAQKGYTLTDTQLLKDDGNTQIPFTTFREITKLADVVYHPLSYYQ